MSSQSQPTQNNYQDMTVSGDARVLMGNFYNNSQAQPAPPTPPPPPPPSPLSTAPFPRDPDYIDRHPLEDEIHKQLSTPAARVALVGFGGLGKSQLAIEYSYRLREQAPEWWVIWIHASSAARFEQSIRDALDFLNVCGRDDSDADTLQLFSSWLRDDQERKWLIILDNVDDAAVLLGSSMSTGAAFGKRLVDYLPVCPNGKLLVTSRTEVAARSIVDDRNIITVRPMSELHASALARTKLKSQPDPDDISGLIKYLEYIPLAITQATAYISQREPRVTVRDYVDIAARSNAAKRSILDRNEGDLRRDREATNAIFLTLQISMEHIEKIRPSASDLLSLMSCFDRQAIHENLLRNPIHYSRWSRHSIRNEDDENSDYGGNGDTSESDDESEDSDHHFDESFEDDVTLLRGYSFISITTDPSIFQMHRIVRIAIQRWSKHKGCRQHWQTLFVYNLCDAFPNPGLSNMKLCSSLYPHAMVAAELHSTDKSARQMLLLHRARGYATLKGNHADSLKLARKAYSIVQDLVKPEHPWTCSLLLSLVDALMDVKGFEEAIEKSELAFQLSRKVYGDKHELTLFSRKRLLHAAYYRDGHRDAGKISSEIDKELLTILPKLRAKRNYWTMFNTLRVAMDISLFRATARVKEHFELTLAFLTKMLNEEHSDSLRCASRITSLPRVPGWDSIAKKMIIRDLDTTRRTLGEDHLSTLGRMIVLAKIFSMASSFGEAAELIVQVIERTMRSLGEEHAFTQNCIVLLACIKLGRGRDQKAMSLLTSAVERWVKAIGSDDPEALALSRLLQKCCILFEVMPLTIPDAGYAYEGILDTEA